MNKILLMGIVLIVGVVGWWFFMDSNTVSYVASFTDEVAALETELASLEAEVVAGTLTPQAASAAQARIEARLEVLTDASVSAQAATLTPAQRTQLLAGLDKLTQILITYQDTLQVVDEQVATLPAAERPALRTGNGSIRLQVVAAIEVISEQLATELPVETANATEAEVATETATTAEAAAATTDAANDAGVADEVDTAATVDVATESETESTIEDDATTNSESSAELEAELTTATTS